MKYFKQIVLWSILVIILAGCSKDGKAPDTSSDGQKKPDQENIAVSTEQLFEEAETTEQKVAALLNKMSLEEKVGQMLQGERFAVTDRDMEKLGLGSVLSGGGSYPGENTLEDWNDMVDYLQKGAMKTKNHIPMLYGIDAVHGVGHMYGTVIFPHNIGLGAANDTELMYQMGAAVAEEMKLMKVLWNFSPCVAVSTDPRWGRTYESYSSDPAIVTSLAEAYLQGQADHGVVSTAKHYAADGGAEYGTGEGDNLIDRGDVTVSEEELRATHLEPYKRLVESGVQIIMASFTSYNGLKMHENKYIMTDILKEEFGFQGFVVSDWEGTAGLSGETFEENVALAVNAGIDMLMEPYNYAAAHAAIIDAVDNGVISMERIDDAVSRILTVKINMGLFNDPYQEKVSHEVTMMGSAGYRELAKQLVEKSLVLLKNDNNTLPLKEGQKVFVTGPALSDIGMQCGGWGLTWQGLMDHGDIKTTEGTTILEGLKEYAEKYGFEIITDEDRAEEADVVLLAIGEIPYAEWNGDTADLSITGRLSHSGNMDAIMRASTLDKPVITLLVVGRNVLIEEYCNDWDSIVMCYLPGTEGDGIASVLSGEKEFTGKLAMPYYKSTEDIGKVGADLKFEVGYGLSY